MNIKNIEIEQQRLESKLQEYSRLYDTIGHFPRDDEFWCRVEQFLTKECDWTEEGAKHLARLVRLYGSFVLTNAAALSISLGIEDGRMGL